MTKSLARMGSRRNGHSGSHKNARRITKGIIHVQASFNNTIVTVTDVRDQDQKYLAYVSLGNIVT
ncbi:hypothetical protein SAY87_026501 [Trapa incisa]|uniref:Ribosomal protein S11 n=1 Tax=Trapa incisa TaxID=236973 RepID=A0AAN7H3Y5_9MYRT|nr:hypothetical protein SAY87_026501 [Trapa incisa]